MARRNGIVDLLETYDDRKKNINRQNQRAKVVAVTATTALIRIGGSQQTQEASVPNNSDIEVGDDVFVNPNQNRGRVRWVITSVMASRDTPKNIGSESQYREIFPPSNVSIIEESIGSITVGWDVPITVPFAFQVQTDADFAIGENSYSVQTRGCYGIITTEAETDVRVRSVAPDGQKSGWTEWLTGTPVESSSSSLERGLIVTSEGSVITDYGSIVRYNPTTEELYTLSEA